MRLITAELWILGFVGLFVSILGSTGLLGGLTMWLQSLVLWQTVLVATGMATTTVALAHLLQIRI